MNSRKIFNWWTLLIGIVIAVVVIFLGDHFIKSAKSLPQIPDELPIELHFIPASTHTPPVPSPTPTKVITVAPVSTIPPEPEGVMIGSKVQVVGTEGEGLRLRSAPGLDSTTNLLGGDHEVFQVVEGPVNSDGFVWWHLEGLYDQTRAGWGVSNYLELINTP